MNNKASRALQPTQSVNNYYDWVHQANKET